MRSILSGRFRLRERLFFKLMVSLGLVLLVLIAVFTVTSIKTIEHRSVNNMSHSAAVFSDMIKQVTYYGMLTHEQESVDRIVDEISRQEGVERVRILDDNGLIAFSSRREEVGKTVDLQADCAGCHAKAQPLEGLRLSQCIRIDSTGGADPHRVISLTNPILNEEACFSAACHAHPSDQSVLGVLDIGFSLAGVDNQVSGMTKTVIGIAVLMFLILAGVVGLVTFLFVNRPLSSLVEATSRITKGDYDRPILPATKDEIGILAESFNKMRLAIREKTDDLEESRRLFKTLFEQVPCYISVQDKNYRLLNFNKMFERDFGNRPGEPCYVVYKGRDSICPNCAVEKSFSDGQTHWAQEVVIGKDGSEIHFLNLATPLFDNEGDIIAVMEVATDITPIHRLEDELRKSEEKYRLFFDNNPNPVFVFDRTSLEILDANERALADYRFERKALIGSSFLELTDPADQARVKTFVEEGGAFLPRLHHLRSDGTSLFINLRASFSEHLGREAVIVAVADLTEQMETEQQLIQATKMATLGEMAAGVAHELNQPLSVILTGGNFLLKRLKDGQTLDIERLKEVVEEIIGQVGRSERIINHLREFGRKADVERSLVSLNEPIQGVFSLLGQQMRIHNIRIETELDPDLPPIWGDVNRLEQVFINLVFNARDAIEQSWKEKDGNEQGLIRVWTGVQEGQVVATVTDNGVGLGPEELKRIFEPFYTTKSASRGTGLGLSISYSIVRDYEGRIEVDTEPGQGATFRLIFPVAEREA